MGASQLMGSFFLIPLKMYMKIVILIFIIALTFIFGIPFVIGVITAATQGSDKKRRARAIYALSQMTVEQRTVLIKIYATYKAKDPNQANKIVKEASATLINFLIDYFDYNNRPIEYFSGTFGKFLFIDFENKLKKLGYSEAVSKIIPGVVMDNYNEVLEKMIIKKEKTPQKSISILGEEIDPDNMPKLYRWAKNNPETLERQLKSIAKAWHQGDIRAAMIAFESDLEHG